MADERFSKQAVQIAQIAATLWAADVDGFSTETALKEAFAMVKKADEWLADERFDGHD